MCRYKQRRTTGETKTPQLHRIIFNLEASQRARTPPSKTPKNTAARSRHPRIGDAPGPKAKRSRRTHQLRRAGFEGEERSSAGDHPRATSIPDLGPTPSHHLNRGGQIFHLPATAPHSSRPAPPPPASPTPVTDPPPTPEKQRQNGDAPAALKHRRRRRRGGEAAAHQNDEIGRAHV